MKQNKKKVASGKLLKYVIKEDGKILMELLPTKSNEAKVRRMSYMAGIEVVKIFDQ